jgi:hypothetical protein
LVTVKAVECISEAGLVRGSSATVGRLEIHLRIARMANLPEKVASMADFCTVGSAVRRHDIPVVRE